MVIFLSFLVFTMFYCVSVYILYSSIAVFLDCFRILVTMTNASISWVCSYLFEMMILFPSHIYPEMGLLNHMMVLFLVF